MEDIAVYKNHNNHKFVLLGVYYVLECKYYTILFLNEQNLQPHIHSWTAEQIIGSQRLGYVNCTTAYNVCRRAYIKAKHMFDSTHWTLTDEEFMHVDGLLKSVEKVLPVEYRQCNQNIHGNWSR